MELRVARQKVGQILITEKLYTTHTLAQRGEISAAFRDTTAAIAAGMRLWYLEFFFL